MMTNLSFKTGVLPVLFLLLTLPSFAQRPVASPGALSASKAKELKLETGDIVFAVVIPTVVLPLTRAKNAKNLKGA